jgi:hypothetical protein
MLADSNTVRISVAPMSNETATPNPICWNACVRTVLGSG